MPCDGIAVLTAQAQAVQDVLDAMQAVVVSGPTYQGTTCFLVISLSGLPVKVAIEANGKITAITQSGTFEVGVQKLKKWIEQAAKQGVKLDGVKFESHRHEKHAPQLAYTQSQR